MTENQKTIERYMERFRQSDPQQVLACLTDDVEWEIPGMFHIHGKDAYARHVVEDEFVPKPSITVHRMIEQGDVVVAEGAVRTTRKDGTTMNLVFCDVFDMRDAKIRKLVSYLMPTK